MSRWPLRDDALQINAVMSNVSQSLLSVVAVSVVAAWPGGRRTHFRVLQTTQRRSV